MTETSGVELRVVGAVRVRVPLRRPLLTAHGAWPVCDSWLVRVVDAADRPGVGEATLGPFARPTDQADLDARIRRLVGGSIHIGEPDAGIVDAVDGALRAALDGALLDLGLVLVDRPRAATIRVNALVGAESLHAAVAAAREAAEAGFDTIKLKGGGEASTAELVERLLAVRAAVGPAVRLRLDVNGAWDARTASERLQSIAGAGLELVEQPIAPGPIDVVAATMAELRAVTGQALGADESVTSRAAARVLLEAGAVDALVVKPARVGGPRATLAIAADAAASGMAVVVSTLLETGVGLLTAMATAAMLPADGMAGGPGAVAHGLGTGGGLATDLVGGRSVVADGRASVEPGPRLAAALDEAGLERFAMERHGAWA